MVLSAAGLPSSVPRRLFHVTAAENLPSILDNGLVTATTLVEGSELPRDRVMVLLDHPRVESVRIDSPVHGQAWVRDQRRMTATGLQRVLDDGLSPQDWCRMLNGMVFFFPTKEAAAAMSRASQYSHLPQVLLELDTERLVDDFGTEVRVATFNTGSTSQGGATKRRGKASFIPALRYAGTRAAIREITVTSDIRHIDRYLVGQHPLP